VSPEEQRVLDIGLLTRGIEDELGDRRVHVFRNPGELGLDLPSGQQFS